MPQPPPHHHPLLQLYRSPLTSRDAFPSLLNITSRLRKLHITDPDPTHWDDLLCARGVLSLVHLEELRLHCTDPLSYDHSPFTALLIGMSGGSLPPPPAALLDFDVTIREAEADEMSVAVMRTGGEGASAHADAEEGPLLTASVSAASSGAGASPRNAGGGGVGGLGSGIHRIDASASASASAPASALASASASAAASASASAAGGSGAAAALPRPRGATGGAWASASTAAPRLPLAYLKKLMLSSRLDEAGTEALTRYLGDGQRRSIRLKKLKLSTSLISSPGGSAVLAALSRHPALRKLTVLRPEGMGEPIRKNQCHLISEAMVACRTLYSVHIRRAGMWTDTLAALQPLVTVPNITCIKLDSNSLAYLSAGAFNDALDALLSRLPALKALHLGNNQLDANQATALAASLRRFKIDRLTSLTLGSNDIGDAGLKAVLEVLPAGMEQLYLHGTAITDEGVPALREGLDRFTSLWGLGLNGNPITDSGVRALCRSLRARPALQDIGITLSDSEFGVGWRGGMRRGGDVRTKVRARTRSARGDV